ncbi:dihydroorotase [Seinonella peptonophila]|uniref:Dihydroorotase n=1 Tax=Seinonella peptonophila TaxID=112248 RepID=A0A1M4UXZ5_9BACL|nr:dihydroorotase [Seinonella peptonophila]SHE61538.1 dihydroorotase [Seinonella peptonophila]
MSRVLLKNGRIYDEAEQQWVQRDLLIQDGLIRQIGTKIEQQQVDQIDLAGKHLVPGFIDMHIHLREPGFEEKETIETGSRAAAKGGYTTIACMPNTRPVTDSKEIVEQIVHTAKEVGLARVLPIGAITKRELGRELTDMNQLKKAGIVAVSDDGVGVQSSRMMKEAMREAHRVGLPVVAHCEDESILVKGASVHDGQFARKYDLKGIPSEAESIHIARDILLAEDIGVHYHVCHISTAQSVRLVREAKSRGQKVTAEVTPHHLLLCEDDIPQPDPMYKMNPPLRSRKDQQALIEGLLDGTIDFIATDHAPHTLTEKAQGMELAPFGIVGLETAFPLLYTHFVCTGKLSLQQLIERMTQKPADCFGLPWGRIAVDMSADLTLLDLEKEEAIDPATFVSKGKNTPFSGWRVKGWPVKTWLAGTLTWNQ